MDAPTPEKVTVLRKVIYQIKRNFLSVTVPLIFGYYIYKDYSRTQRYQAARRLPTPETEIWRYAASLRLYNQYKLRPRITTTSLYWQYGGFPWRIVKSVIVRVVLFTFHQIGNSTNSMRGDNFADLGSVGNITVLYRRYKLCIWELCPRREQSYLHSLCHTTPKCRACTDRLSDVKYKVISHNAERLSESFKKHHIGHIRWVCNKSSPKPQGIPWIRFMIHGGRIPKLYQTLSNRNLSTLD